MSAAGRVFESINFDNSGRIDYDEVRTFVRAKLESYAAGGSLEEQPGASMRQSHKDRTGWDPRAMNASTIHGGRAR